MLESGRNVRHCTDEYDVVSFVRALLLLPGSFIEKPGILKYCRIFHE
jgi:hypothetical protein